MRRQTALILQIFIFLLAMLPGSAQGQTSPTDSAVSLSLNLYGTIGDRAQKVERQIDGATEKYLSKLQKQEQKLQKKIAAKDSLLAKQLFAGVEEKYASLKSTPQKLSRYASFYSGHLDSLSTSLNFLKATGVSSEAINNSLSQFSLLQDKFNQTEAIKKFLSDRKQFLHDQLERLGMLKELKGFSKQAYYYSSQLKEVKAMWEDPEKLEKKLLEYVVASDKFKDFFHNNSQLASLFSLPSGNTSSVAPQGLQTRASVQQAILARFGSGPNVQAMLQQNIQSAQGQLNELKNKLTGFSSGSFGNGNGNIDVPEGFKLNTQHTKTFLQRLEYGANLQSQKARNYFPVTSDLGLSLGYKLNDKSSIGIGASYKLGWGRSWNNIRVTNEGIGLRSYLDYKLKGSLHISGGYEQNHRTAFSSIQQLKDYSAWQSSGLIGLSKKYKVSKKVKGDMKLLWDFLSYQQIPKTQAILFRIGYSLK